MIDAKTHLVGMRLYAEGLADRDDLEQERQVSLPADSPQHVRVVIQYLLQCRLG